MKHKKIFCSLILFLSMCCLPITTEAQENISSNPLPVETSTPSYAKDGDSSSYAYDIRWVYKIENGITYRRKYNFTLKKWVGDWERVN